MFMSETKPHGGTALWWCCDGCGVQAWPVQRIVGMPTEKAWAAVDKGLAVLVGCDPGAITDGHRFECPSCSQGCELAEELIAEGWWDPDSVQNQ